MKKTTKITAILLAMLMLASFSGTAFADSILDAETGGPVLCDPYTDAGWIQVDHLTPTDSLDLNSPFAAQAIDDLSVIKGTQPAYRESNVGAHYYVFGAESTAYTEAFVNVKLPTELNITSGSDKRHAFFGLGVRGSQKGIDFGITYQGNGWMPCFNDPYKGISGDSSVTGGAVYTGCVAPSTATNAIMVVKPVSTTLVEFYVRFTDADNNTVGDTFWMQIPVAEGNLTAAANGRFNCTFFRFASLVPDIGVPDDQTDGSYMRGGRFTGCQLYNGTSYVAWGIGNSTVVQAWKVSPERITVTYSGTTDIVDINHWST